MDETNAQLRTRPRIFFWLVIGIIVSCLAAKETFAQQISLNYMEYSGNRIILHYDLVDSIEGRSFTIRLYSSADGFLNPLTKISGDQGLEVGSGKNRTITWLAADELGDSFEGRVALEIRGRLFVPFINTESIDKYKVYKRARSYTITWSGGTPQNVLNFDLIKGTRKITTFPNLANVGHAAIQFPGYVSPGTYRFRISDAKNRDEVVYSQPFRIKRKIPLIAKIIPGIGVAAGAAVIISGLNGGKGDDAIGEPPTPNK